MRMPMGLWTTSSGGTRSRNSNRSATDQRSRRTSCPPARCTSSKSAVAPWGGSGEGWMRSTTRSTWRSVSAVPGGRGGHVVAVARERGVGEFGRQEPEAPGPVLLDGRAAARVEVVDEPVEKILGRGIERIGLGGGGLVGERFGASDLVDPHHDGLGRLGARDPQQDEDAEDAARGEEDQDGSQLPVRLHGLAPDLGVLAAGITVSFHSRDLLRCLRRAAWRGRRPVRPAPCMTSATNPDPVGAGAGDEHRALSSPTLSPAHEARDDERHQDDGPEPELARDRRCRCP